MARGHVSVAVVLLLAVTGVAAAAVVTVVPALLGGPPPQRGIGADATSDGRVAVTVLAGESLDVRESSVWISVDGERLGLQPPVPFFAARGFRGGPTESFNVAADSTWSVGETASLRVAGTNSPELRAGASLTVEVYVDGRAMAVAETTVEKA